MQDTRPPALDWSNENCQVERAMAVLGERYAVVVLREVFMGVRRFEDIRRHSGVSRQVLSDRLASLVDEGILVRAAYQEAGARQRFEYRLTEKGFGLYPVLAALAEWGGQHYSGAEGPVVRIVHRDCEQDVQVALRCAEHGDLAPRDLAPRPGPGARRLEA